MVFDWGRVKYCQKKFITSLATSFPVLRLDSTFSFCLHLSVSVQAFPVPSPGYVKDFFKLSGTHYYAVPQVLRLLAGLLSSLHLLKSSSAILCLEFLVVLREKRRRERLSQAILYSVMFSDVSSIFSTKFSLDRGIQHKI